MNVIYGIYFFGKIITMMLILCTVKQVIVEISTVRQHNTDFH